jgi:GxxExxY protein
MLKKAMEDSLKHRELTDKIIGTFYEVYNELGFGFLESVYEKAMIIALRAKDLRAENQIEINVWFRGDRIGTFFTDILVENLVILELKAVRGIDNSHKAQLLNYLRATEIEVGILLNFGQQPEFKRLAFDNQRKKHKSNNYLIENVLSEN